MEQTHFTYQKEFHCSCGRTHRTQIQDILIEKGALRRLPELLKGYRAQKPFLLADKNTYEAAGQKVRDILTAEAFPLSSYVFADSPEPDESAVGSCVMHFDVTCDIILAVGSGVLNDLGKLLSHISGKPYIIIATAPSMDGYASATSSMAMDGLKVSLPTVCPKAILGDTDILRQAPRRMLLAGLGDMLAKYISICEWRLSHIITGEYYCETIAGLVRKALAKCVQSADGLLGRDERAVAAVFEGLITGGLAMGYAGISRPASGVEHYFSHIWDMRGLEFHTSTDLHGIQCAVATLIAARLYEQLPLIPLNREAALLHAASFDYEAWSLRLREFLGKGADAMIALEQREHKYDPALHAKRLAIILDRWDEILSVIREEIPPSSTLEQLLTSLKAPKTAAELKVDPATLPMTFAATRDIRDKYVLSRLAWDLDITRRLMETLNGPQTAKE